MAQRCTRRCTTQAERLLLQLQGCRLSAEPSLAQGARATLAQATPGVLGWLDETNSMPLTPTYDTTRVVLYTQA